MAFSGDMGGTGGEPSEESEGNFGYGVGYGADYGGGQGLISNIENLLGSFADPFTGSLFNEPGAMGSFVDLAGNPIDSQANNSGQALGSFSNPSDAWGSIDDLFSQRAGYPYKAAGWKWTAKGLAFGLMTAGVPGAIVGAITGKIADFIAQGSSLSDSVRVGLEQAGLSGKVDSGSVISSLNSNPTGAGGTSSGGGSGAGLVDQISGTPAGQASSAVTPSSGPTDLAGISLDIYNKTNPARQEIINRGTNFLQGNLDVTQSPVWGSSKNAAEVQYRLARDATMANLPAGGALQSSLATGETNKARTLTDLASSIGMDEYNKIYGMVTGAPQQTISGLSSAANTSATLAGQQIYKNAQEDAQKNQLYADLGSGIGEGLGDK